MVRGGLFGEQFMSADAIVRECSEKMDKAIGFLKQELKGIRTGRAHPGLVEGLKVEVASYGSTMQLKELASISVPEPMTLLVKPFDPGTLKDIEKGIQTSSLGVTPVNDGKSIRLPMPPLSGERRQQLVQQVKKMAEEQKIAIRNTRRDGNKAVDAAEKAKTLSEDQAHDFKDQIQKLTKKHEDEVDSIVKAKTFEIEDV
jgi:ribosome recycling factor